MHRGSVGAKPSFMQTIASGSEARSRHRRRCFRGASIVFNARSSLISCTVKDMSDAGARLQVDTTADIPSEFELHFPQLQFTARARLAWRHGRDCGVSLAPPPDQTSPHRTSHQARERISS